MNDVDEDRNPARPTAVDIYVDIVRARIAAWRDATPDAAAPDETMPAVGGDE